MNPRERVPHELSELARHQAMVVSREQALAIGFGRHAITRVVREGTWRRLTPGIYLTAAVQPPWEAWAWGGVLVGGDQARLGGSAAAYLHGITESAPEPIVVLVPASARPRRLGPWTFVREAPGMRGRSLGSPPRLGVEDTLIDLIDGSETDERHIVHLVTTAVQRHRTTPARMLRALERRRFVSHRRFLTDLLMDVEVGVRSPLERNYLTQVERAHGLPTGERQQRHRNTVVDIWYRLFGVLVELDGRRGHEGVGRFRDMWRDNVAAVDGLTTLRYGYGDVCGVPCEVASQVGTVLVRGGWAGPVQRCRRCRRVA